MDQLKNTLPLLLLSNSKTNPTTAIIGFIWFMIVDAFIKYLPLLIEQSKGFLFRKVTPKIDNIMKDSTIVSKIIFERSYANKTQDNVADSILNYICNIDSAKELFFKDFYLANKKDIFDINSSVSVKILDIHFEKDQLSKVKFEIFSKTLQLTELRQWCDNIEKNYNIEKKNKFGNTRYFLDEIIADIPLGDTQKVFYFNMTEFSTNKSLKNIYGEHLDVLKKRVKMFVENPKWYADNGIPYTLGILFHGPPGTGKTSTAKAIAKDTGRHIINIKLREDTTQEQISSLFQNENIMVRLPGSNNFTSVVIPIDKRLYIIEDIDTLNKVVLDRKYQEQEKEEIPQNIIPSDMHNHMKRNKQNKKITLGFLLNLLDGILETPGRILIMTSNYPERLDKALIRPGRIDINLRLGYCTNYMLQSMFNGFYGFVNFPFNFENIYITPAKVQEILCNNISDSEKAYNQLSNAIKEEFENQKNCETS